MIRHCFHFISSSHSRALLKQVAPVFFGKFINCRKVVYKSSLGGLQQQQLLNYARAHTRHMCVCVWMRLVCRKLNYFWVFLLMLMWLGCLWISFIHGEILSSREEFVFFCACLFAWAMKSCSIDWLDAYWKARKTQNRYSWLFS